MKKLKGVRGGRFKIGSTTYSGIIRTRTTGKKTFFGVNFT